MSARHQALLAELGRANLAGLALVPGANLDYILGLSIHPSERLSVAFFDTHGAIRMVLPALEQPRAASEARLPVQFYTWNDSEGFGPALHQCLAEAALGERLGVEYTGMRVLELRAIEAVSRVAVEDATPLLARLRMVKDAEEIRAMRAAVRVAEEGLHAAIEAIRPGVTEREVAAVWEGAMRSAGAEPSFPTIVASGPNSANPHHTTGGRAIERGDLVILDGGARVEGYCSDITRTVAVGDVPEQARAIYELVLAANRGGVAAVRPGISGAEIDAAAREIIDRGGFGPRFVHRTGHGLGIEIHEPPYLHVGEPTPLPEGATFTIEPGIYLPELGGVRIEDDVVIGKEGGHCLTTFPRELRVLGE